LPDLSFRSILQNRPDEPSPGTCFVASTPDPYNRDDPNGTAVTPVPTPRREGVRGYLVHVDPGGGPGGRYPLGKAPVLVGRGDDGTVSDPDPSVSRRHAIVIQRSDGQFLLTDLGSLNGTFVNDARVDSAVLGDGDRVRFGNSEYRFLAILTP
jgi:hypothetical protein